jgi:hypothetical protein
VPLKLQRAELHKDPHHDISPSKDGSRCLYHVLSHHDAPLGAFQGGGNFAVWCSCCCCVGEQIELWCALHAKHVPLLMVWLQRGQQSVLQLELCCSIDRCMVEAVRHSCRLSPLSQGLHRMRPHYASWLACCHLGGDGHCPGVRVKEGLWQLLESTHQQRRLPAHPTTWLQCQQQQQHC